MDSTNISERQLKEIWSQLNHNITIVQTSGGKIGEKGYFKNNNYLIQATCLSNIKPGLAIALLTDKNNWYLLSEDSVNNEQTRKRTIEYRANKLVKKITSKVKVLFAAHEEGKTNFYIGGDRSTPELIYTIDRLIPQSQIYGFIANRGGLNDWSVSITQTLNPSVLDTPVLIDSNGSIKFEDLNPYNYYLGYLGDGIWQSDEFTTTGYTIDGLHTPPCTKNVSIQKQGLSINQGEVTFLTVSGESDGQGEGIPVTHLKNTSKIPNITGGGDFEYNRTVEVTGYEEYKIAIKGSGDFVFGKFVDDFFLEKTYSEINETKTRQNDIIERITNTSYYLCSEAEELQLNDDDFIVIDFSELPIILNGSCIVKNFSQSEYPIRETLYKYRNLPNYDSFANHPVFISYREEDDTCRLVKGNILNIEIDFFVDDRDYLQINLTAEVSIREITSPGNTSFVGKLISANGSLHAYESSINNSSPYANTYDVGNSVTTTKNNFPFGLCYSPLNLFNSLSYNSSSLVFIRNIERLLGSQMDNLIDRVIYRTIYEYSNKIFLEEWKIEDNGLINYAGGSYVKIYPLKALSNDSNIYVLSSSYYS